jgi:hypothetical protein
VTRWFFHALLAGGVRPVSVSVSIDNVTRTSGEEYMQGQSDDCDSMRAGSCSHTGYGRHKHVETLPDGNILRSYLVCLNCREMLTETVITYGPDDRAKTVSAASEWPFGGFQENEIIREHWQNKEVTRAGIALTHVPTGIKVKRVYDWEACMSNRGITALLALELKSKLDAQAPSDGRTC